ncbi:hypothetical protein AVEN_111996-1 [Araneus ventricosus]|uniref:Uncharacterized protein n=1 Tax=Araneus ventricosus TaxID=182803 RepID=A0A4Y2HZZ3_ARAVE|nr:hypothetical protein AVEN_111996-1 [Araneus ventricosus]
MHEPLCKDRCFCLEARGSFCQDGDVIFCNDVDSLFKALGPQHNPQEWRLFIDSSKWDRKKYYIKKVWPKRQFQISGVKNEENEPIGASEKILLPPLHIKLGLMKNFIKAMDCGGSGFQYLHLKFPKESETKIKEGIFVEPQFRQIMKDPVLESKLTKKEAAAWTTFKELEKMLLRKSQSGTLRQIVNSLLKGLQNYGMQHVFENPFLALSLRILP